MQSLRSRGRHFQAATYALVDQLNQLLQLVLGRSLVALKSGWSFVATDVGASRNLRVLWSKAYVDIQ